jgi:hypothetical protein
MNKYYPNFPLYIPSKGRWEYMITSKALTEMGVSHFIVVEPQEAEQYQMAIKRLGLLAKVLVLDMSYKKTYELCDNHGLNKSTGSGPARNYIWDHSISEGAKYHWIMDDNIVRFSRMHKNERIKTTSSSIWRAMEDFVLRYMNVGMAGPCYEMFAYSGSQKLPPYITNTRIYSCNLIRNDIPFRWRGRYNEDTILSLDMLKKGWCTIQFNAFLQGKMTTQTIKGGNTDELYKEGTKAKSIMLKEQHPDLTRVVIRYGRPHHKVNYSPFRKNKLIRRRNLVIEKKDKEYGMILKKKKIKK